MDTFGTQFVIVVEAGIIATEAQIVKNRDCRSRCPDEAISGRDSEMSMPVIVVVLGIIVTEAQILENRDCRLGLENV